METAEWSLMNVITVDVSRGLLTVDQSLLQAGHLWIP